MTSGSRESHFMEGLLLGGLMGAALGIVFAPFAGEKMREKIKEKLENNGVPCFSFPENAIKAISRFIDYNA